MDNYLEFIEEVSDAGNEVIDAWESGNLAAAVNYLREILEHYGKRTTPQNQVDDVLDVNVIQYSTRES